CERDINQRRSAFLLIPKSKVTCTLLLLKSYCTSTCSTSTYTTMSAYTSTLFASSLEDLNTLASTTILSLETASVCSDSLNPFLDPSDLTSSVRPSASLLSLTTALASSPLDSGSDSGSPNSGDSDGAVKSASSLHSRRDTSIRPLSAAEEVLPVTDSDMDFMCKGPFSPKSGRLIDPELNESETDRLLQCSDMSSYEASGATERSKPAPALALHNRLKPSRASTTPNARPGRDGYAVLGETPSDTLGAPSATGAWGTLKRSLSTASKKRRSASVAPSPPVQGEEDVIGVMRYSLDSRPEVTFVSAVGGSSTQSDLPVASVDAPASGSAGPGKGSLVRLFSGMKGPKKDGSSGSSPLSASNSDSI
ncbi:hypothetical protein DFP72DRAFT_1123531, partial [Ephemerocybe angulata]